MRAAIVAAAVAAASLFGGQAAAACDPGKAGADLSFEEANEVYECIAEELHAGYVKGNKRWIPADYVNDFRGWAKASTVPAAPGFHGGRFLVTWVNEVGAEEYMKYAEAPSIPAGTVIAKESFQVTDGGKVRKGPLFLMEKVAAGSSPQTDDWYYMMVGANGSPQAVPVVTACHDCHSGFDYQGNLGYPVEEARVK